MVAIDVLRRFKMFRDVSADSLARLSQSMQSVSMAASQVISREAEEGPTLYLVVSGLVRVEKKTFEEKGGSKVVARLGAGEFFGEMSFLQGTPHSATVIAETDVELIEISRGSLNELIRSDSTAAVEQVLTIAAGLSGRLRSTTRELVTVYEVARAIASASTIEELSRVVVGQLQLDLGRDTQVAFYRWNIFNQELGLVTTQGAGSTSVPVIIDDAMALSKLMTTSRSEDNLGPGRGVIPFPYQHGHLVLTPVRSAEDLFGLFVYHSDTPASFDGGEQQMMNTVAAVMAPALASLQHREEEAARKQLERSKQGGFSF